MPGNPFGDYGDVDLGSVYYGSQAAQSAQTGQPVANPDGTNAPHGVDPETGLAMTGPPPANPARDAAAADINQTVQAWLVANGRPPTDGVTTQELITILNQQQLDTAIQFGLFGPVGAPIGGYTQSMSANPVGPQAGVPASAAPGGATPAQQANDRAAWDYFTAGGTGTYTNPTPNDDTMRPVANPDGTYSYNGLTLVGTSLPPAQQRAAAAQASNQNTMIGNPGIGYGGVTPQQAQQYAANQTAKATRMYERALPPDPSAAPPPPGNETAQPPGTRPVRYPIGPGGALGEPRRTPASNNGRPGRDLSQSVVGPQNPPVPNRVTMPAPPANMPILNQAHQALSRIVPPNIPGYQDKIDQAQDWFQSLRDRFDDIELRIRKPRDRGATIQPVE